MSHRVVGPTLNWREDPGDTSSCVEKSHKTSTRSTFPHMEIHVEAALLYRPKAQVVQLNILSYKAETKSSTQRPEIIPTATFNVFAECTMKNTVAQAMLAGVEVKDAYGSKEEAKLTCLRFSSHPDTST